MGKTLRKLEREMANGRSNNSRIESDRSETLVRLYQRDNFKQQKQAKRFCYGNS